MDWSLPTLNVVKCVLRLTISLVIWKRVLRLYLCIIGCRVPPKVIMWVEISYKLSCPSIARKLRRIYFSYDVTLKFLGNMVVDVKSPNMYTMLWWNNGVIPGIHGVVKASCCSVVWTNLIVMSFLWVFGLDKWWWLN